MRTGNPVSSPCDFVFKSVASRATKELQREITLAGEARLPEPENMKPAHVDKALTRLAQKVWSAGHTYTIAVLAIGHICCTLFKVGQCMVAHSVCRGDSAVECASDEEGKWHALH